jgi:RNA polymerase sigma factor (sigma-70 family)
MVMEPSDEVLLSACRRGDEVAWGLLVDRYKRLIFTIARRSGLDEEQASDVLQRVFTILIEYLDTIEQPASLASWLTGTTRREAWRERRRARIYSAMTEDASEAVESIEDQDDLPEEALLRLEGQHRLRLALESLDGRCRELLTLLFLSKDPLTYAEIAEVMQMRQGAIGPTRARCLEKLRRLLPDDII